MRQQLVDEFNNVIADTAERATWYTRIASAENEVDYLNALDSQPTPTGADTVLEAQLGTQLDPDASADLDCG